jgi:hypothetical protein
LSIAPGYPDYRHYTFLNLLRERACVFIGASMKDDNIRRLLHYSTKEQVRAFEEEGKTPDSARACAIRHFAVLKHYHLKAMDDAVEESLKALGTRVLWVKDFEEIPTQLGKMYEAAGHDWGAVYESEKQLRPRSGGRGRRRRESEGSQGPKSAGGRRVKSARPRGRAADQRRRHG